MARLSAALILTLLLTTTASPTSQPQHERRLTHEIRVWKPKPHVPIDSGGDITPDVTPEYPGTSHPDEDDREGTPKKNPPPPEEGEAQVSCDDDVEDECLTDAEDGEEDEDTGSGENGSEESEDDEDGATMKDVDGGLLIGVLTVAGLLTF